MKKAGISAVLTAIVFGVPTVSGAAYPVYPAYQNNNYGVAQPVVYQPVPPQQATQVIYTNPSAAQPTRITGQLPRVGSNATNSGRQYYQPADYDRLADSGLYFGLSVAYSASVMGSMNADYTSEPKSFFVPGAFQPADFKADAVIPIQLSIGAAINNDFRVDFSYTRYGGIEYPQTVETSDGAGGFVTAQASGGAITANATMLNVYYNIDSYTGYMVGGSLRPYIGAGVGIALNTISDYVVYDGTFYSEMDPTQANAGQLTGVSDIYAYHSGGTKENLAYMLEAGVTTELDGGIKLDFFARYSGLGKVQNSGSIVVSQTEWLGDGNGGEVQAPYDSVYHYTNWYESGNLSTVDLGIRMRLQF